jgi:hypothetical protein
MLPCPAFPASTAANVEALWVARKLKYLPVALRWSCEALGIGASQLVHVPIDAHQYGDAALPLVRELGFTREDYLRAGGVAVIRCTVMNPFFCAEGEDERVSAFLDGLRKATAECPAPCPSEPIRRPDLPIRRDKGLRRTEALLERALTGVEVHGPPGLDARGRSAEPLRQLFCASTRQKAFHGLDALLRSERGATELPGPVAEVVARGAGRGHQALEREDQRSRRQA